MTFMRKAESSCAKLIGAQPMGFRALQIKAPSPLGLPDAGPSVVSACGTSGNAQLLSQQNTSVASKEKPHFEDETSSCPIPVHLGRLLLLPTTDSLLR